MCIISRWTDQNTIFITFNRASILFTKKLRIFFIDIIRYEIYYHQIVIHVCIDTLNLNNEMNFNVITNISIQCCRMQKNLTLHMYFRFIILSLFNSHLHAFRICASISSAVIFSHLLFLPFSFTFIRMCIHSPQS